MREIILFCMLFLSANSSFSQTKEETEKWILSKFEKYKLAREHTRPPNGYSIVSTSLQFRDCSMILTQEYSGTKVGIGKTEIDIFTIPVGDIEILKWDNVDLQIALRKYSAIVKSYLSTEDPKKAKTSYMGGCIISLNKLAEDNLDNRLIKAFEHLKTFCRPTKDEKEPF